MNYLVIYYPFLWALLAVLGAFACVLLDILIIELDVLVAKRRTKLRDKLHFSMSQSPKRGNA
jgi:hypothetical protein